MQTTFTTSDSGVQEIEISRIRIEPIDPASEAISWFDSMRIWLERYLGEKVEWSPLPPVNRCSPLMVARLLWEVSGCSNTA